ncbi:hypothetical protein BJY04DRAFT_221968 [Aspergillus karnatakaensis]|uniref:uncharacterized protein n=1 Tax=Aspergillus karnatakaensis TaxID=1810916 RepID=UPI003CCDEDD9
MRAFFQLASLGAFLTKPLQTNPEERTLHPHRLWYYDNPNLFLDNNYLLTNDLGASSAYLVEASNTTHWELAARSASTTGSTDLQSRQVIHYINGYSEGGCIPNSFREQRQNPANGVCVRWNALGIMSAFIVGDGNFQVNFYWGESVSCSTNYLGGVRAWSGCWTTPNKYQLPWFFWPCYTC